MNKTLKYLLMAITGLFYFYCVTKTIPEGKLEIIYWGYMSVLGIVGWSYLTKTNDAVVSAPEKQGEKQ